MRDGEEQVKALDDFEDKLLDGIDKLAYAGVPPYEVVFSAIRIFSHLCFAMAPSEEVARKTIMAGVDTGFEKFKGDEEFTEEEDQGGEDQ
jgi:hypothetical protein